MLNKKYAYGKRIGTFLLSPLGLVDLSPFRGSFLYFIRFHLQGNLLQPFNIDEIMINHFEKKC